MSDCTSDVTFPCYRGGRGVAPLEYEHFPMLRSLLVHPLHPARSSMNSIPSRTDAVAVLTEYTSNESLRKHMLAVEAAMRAYALRFGEDADRWGLAGLLHDFDYERYPNAAHSPSTEHPAEGVRILRGLGYPEDVLAAILGHASYTGVPRDTRMAKCLFAVDELTGLVTATALVKPSRSVREVDAKSVRKKMKDKAFARGVSREDVVTGAADLGIDLDEHIQFVIEAMCGVAPSLGLG
jgi:putative nucleotidyltransferase with HDIG domain